MKKKNFYFRYRNVGVLPCVLSIFFLPYIVEKGFDCFGIILIKMSDLLIAKTFLWIVFIGYFVIETWFVIQLTKEMIRARFSFGKIDRQVILKLFFGKLVMQLVEKWRGKNDCKKL